MAFLFKLISVAAIASVAIAAPSSTESTSSADDYAPLDSDYGSAQDSYQLHQLPPLNLQLPRQEAANIPFFSPEPSTELKAPSENAEANFYQVPIPAQDLIAPIETAWNPNNDPKYFYEVPVIITKQTVPTNAFPKKYNQLLHSKEKPFSSKPKQEITLEPINEKAYLTKEKELYSTFQKLAKKENRKQINNDDKVAKKKLKKFDKVKTKTSTTHKKTSAVHDNNNHYSNVNKDSAELVGEATGFHTGFDSEGVTHQSSSASDFNQGLSAELISSLGIPSSSTHAAHSNGERLEFHLVGHDGPHSYKWGFDTGKGHNRQFRYEERDKEGIVKGHFGFYDKHGKLQMVHYDSHPHEGFHAEGNFGKIHYNQQNEYK